jgi:hypothetical protein
MMMGINEGYPKVPGFSWLRISHLFIVSRVKKNDVQSPENLANSAKMHRLPEGSNWYPSWRNSVDSVSKYWSMFYTMEITIKWCQLHNQEKPQNAPNLINFEVSETIHTFIHYLISILWADKHFHCAWEQQSDQMCWPLGIYFLHKLTESPRLSLSE